jgi:DNA-dependent protein kinase catalytic subunit
MYHFGLKGDEDLRLDERLMQCFRSLNEALHLDIRTYSVIPLTSSLGIMQWVEHAPTLADLFCRGLEQQGCTEADNRNKLFAEGFGDWEKHRPRTGQAMAIQRLEVYEEQLAATSKLNIASLNAMREGIWITARSLERWLTYQMNFAKSLAVMPIFRWPKFGSWMDCPDLPASDEVQSSTDGSGSLFTAQASRHCATPPGLPGHFCWHF